MALQRAVYRPRDAEHTALHQVIAERLEVFLHAVAEAGDSAGLPQFIEREFREFLTCGVFEHGVASTSRCLSATIRAFASADQLRPRPAPVNTSKRCASARFGIRVSTVSDICPPRKTGGKDRPLRGTMEGAVPMTLTMERVTINGMISISTNTTCAPISS
jgi:hypothetical protein